MNQQSHQDYLNLIERVSNCSSREQALKILRANSSLMDLELIEVMIKQAANRMAAIDKLIAELLPDLAKWLAEKVAYHRHLTQQQFELPDQNMSDEILVVAKRALQLASSLYRGNRDDLVTNFNLLAVLLVIVKQYKLAELFFVQTLETLPSDSIYIATTNYMLGGLYKEMRQYKLAESFLLQALEMRRRLLPAEDLIIAYNLVSLGELYKEMGEYNSAILSAEEALEMRRHLLPAEDLDIANTLHLLGILYKEMRQYKLAESFLLQALEMRRRLLPCDHLDIAGSFNMLGILHTEMRQYKLAKSFFIKSLNMLERLLPGEDYNIAICRHNLAGVYREMGQYEPAEFLTRRALKTLKSQSPSNDRTIATCLQSLGMICRELEQYDSAKSLIKEALEIRRRLLPCDHHEIANSLQNLALLIATNCSTEALVLLQEATKIEDKLIRRAFAVSSDRNRLHYLETIRPSLDVFLSLVSQHLSESSEAVQAALDLVLKRKSLTASALAAFNYSLYSGKYPHLQQEFEKLGLLADKIAQLTFSPFSKALEFFSFQSQQAASLERLSELEAEYEHLERNLASQVPELLQEQLSDRSAVAMRLPEGSALVEFVHFDNLDFTAPPDRRWQSSHYIAFVLPAQQPEAVQAIDLGEAKPIDKLIRAFRGELEKPPRDLLGARPARTTRNEGQFNWNIGVELRQKIYDPIQNAISNYEHLFIAPDGALNLLPLQILPLEETGKQLLIDKYNISYLSVGRDILRQQVERQRSAGKPVVLADPDFDFGREQNEQGQSQEQVEELLSNLTEKYFEPAENTRYLGEAVAKMLEVEPYCQAEALVSHITEKGKQCPRVLLIATHGYFSASYEEWERELLQKLLECSIGQEEKILHDYEAHLNWNFFKLIEKQVILLEENRNLDAANKLRKAKAQVKNSLQKAGLDFYQDWLSTRAEDSLLRSGLALAGANTWLAGDSLPEEAGKGILFARDIINLDLWANEITVLVACSSGMGEVIVGEGVFGLRRAFAVAGAKTLIMSLWNVPEKVSVLLMEQFFNNLRNGKGRAEALQTAQNYVRSISIKELRQFPLGQKILQGLLEHKYNTLIKQERRILEHPLENPYFWGAWICLGDTGIISTST